MPRADSLSTRLDTLLEAVFESPSDPFSLYWDIAARITPGEIAQAQKTIRKKLKLKGPLGVETAVLVACLMNLGGFPPLRILHFLSLYVPAGIRLSLFDLAFGAIFLGEPPVPASVLYDLTQYTYLEKRLLVRKSIEISEKLSDSLDPRALLFLYLLALRDDLSNEHVQLIALVLKRSIPSRELRGRIGSASLEEFGEIARAVKTAEERSLELELGAGSGAARGGRSFNHNSASFFLDKYFSDEAIAEARASAPEIPKRPVSPLVPAASPGRSPPAEPPSGDDGSTREESGSGPARQRTRSGRQGGRPPRGTAAVPASSAAPRSSAATRSSDASASSTVAASSAVPTSSAPRAESSTASPSAKSPARRPAQRPARQSARSAARSRRIGGSGLIALPTVLAAIVLAILLGVVPAGLRSPPPAPRTLDSSGAAVPPAASNTKPPAAAPAAAAAVPAEPSEVTYVVKPGDSLWKIFTSMQAAPGDRSGWLDFLSRTQSANGLGDPDQLKPGKVLTLSPPR
jgi:hypothetical protein